jgi:tetraacyldisaccharide 4'-kinase
MKSSLVLPPLSALYGAAIRARLAAYSRGLLSSTQLSVPVISIGNLTVGGTGKTPLVEKVCRILAVKGRKVCVLTRGYRRENASARVLVSDGQSIQAIEKESGDEPFLLAEKLLGIAAVISDADRTAAGEWAIEELNIDAFVLDDGFQHLQLARDLNLVAIDATDPWGGNKLLPLGRLREPRSSLKRADCVVITRAEMRDVAGILNDLQRLVKGRPILISRMVPGALKTLAGEIVKVSDIPQPIAPFCGVGNPESFYHLLRCAGLVLIGTRSLADHHRYSQDEINEIAAEARRSGAHSLITTAKDAVKLRELKFSMPCFVQEIEIQFDDDAVLHKLLYGALANKSKSVAKQY